MHNTGVKSTEMKFGKKLGSAEVMIQSLDIRRANEEPPEFYSARSRVEGSESAIEY